MREILFRGKQEKYPREWVEGMYTIGNFAGKKYHAIERREQRIITNGYEQVMQPYEVIPGTIGQFTGLTDKNGKKIFEGDIVEYNDEYGEITYDEYIAMFVIRFDTWETDFDHIDNNIEVIGNIHDNPDLVKGGAEL